MKAREVWRPIPTQRGQLIGFVLTSEHRLSELSSILFAPSAHWTTIAASNQLDGFPAGDTFYRATFWSPGFQVGYALRMGEERKIALVLLAGAEYAKTF
jgi:hypothetical protein